MSVVVGCTGCGKIKIVESDDDGKPRYSKCRCGQPRVLLLTAIENEERWLRGIGIEDWFAAPKTPRTRGECFDGPRPCPHLRCKHHLGVPGKMGCELDVSEAGAHTYEQIAAALGIDSENAAELVRVEIEQAYERTRKRFPGATRRELVAVLAALLAA